MAPKKRSISSGARTVTPLRADAAALGALGLFAQLQPEIHPALSLWFDSLPRPTPVTPVVSEPPAPPPLPEVSPEVVAVEVVTEPVTTHKVSFDPSVPAAIFLGGLPYGGGSRLESLVEASAAGEASSAHLSTRLFLAGLPWNGPQSEMSLVEMMARATQDAVQRSQQSPLPTRLASALSTQDFLQQLPWNLGADR